LPVIAILKLSINNDKHQNYVLKLHLEKEWQLNLWNPLVPNLAASRNLSFWRWAWAPYQEG